MDPATLVNELTMKSIRSAVAHSLRSEYPFLKPEALERALDNVRLSIEKDIALEEAVMAEAKTRINFFDLPPEIRDQIYGLVLTKPRPECVTLFTLETRMVKRRIVRTWSPGIEHGLAWASHQVRAEACAVYYRQNNFHIFVKGSGMENKVSVLNSFLDHMVRPQGKLFRRLLVFLFDIPGIAIINYIWLRYHGHRIISEDNLGCGPVPKITQEMVVSVFGFQNLGLTRAVVTVGSNPLSQNKVAVIDMKKFIAGEAAEGPVDVAAAAMMDKLEARRRPRRESGGVMRRDRR